MCIDEERPECRRCKKAGYKCQGYDRELIFHNQTTAPSPGGSDAGESSEPPLLLTTTTKLTRAPRELDLSPLEDSALFACLFHNYEYTNFGTPRLNLAAEGKLGPTSFEAARALASEFFAQYQEQSRFHTRASVHYGEALRLLRMDLAGDASKETLVIPIMILITYDVSSARCILEEIQSNP